MNPKPSKHRARRTPLHSIAVALLAAAASQTLALAAITPPAQPQGIVTANTYDGNVRQAIIDGSEPSPDGTFYPGIAELPFTGYTGLGSTAPWEGDPTVPPAGDIRNNYTMRLRFFWYAPKAGQVQFAIASDDPGNLFVSTDADPANKTQVGFEPVWNPVRDFLGGDETAPTRRTVIDDGKDPSPRPENWSPYFTVTQGQILYVEAIANEGGGGDNLAVAARYSDEEAFTDDTIPINGNTSSVDRPDIAKAAFTGVGSTPVGFTLNVVSGAGASGTKLDPSTLVVQLDGQTVQTTPTEVPDGHRAAYTHTGIFPAGSTHTVKATAKDTGGNDMTFDGSFTVGSYGLLTKDLAIPAASVNTGQRGFIWNVFQNSADTRTTNLKGEEALAGLLRDGDGNPLANHADPAALGNALAEGKKLGTADNALVQFEIESFVNWDEAAGNNGAFTPDEQMPGIPGLEGSTDGIAGELITYLELPKGLITMGVNSDDGFKTTAGANPADAATAILLGEFNAGRGAADTIFQFVAEEAGIYAFRTIWEEGGGGANIEWFTINNGTKVLVNDDANGGVKAYRSATVQLPAALLAQVPSKGGTGVPVRPPAISATWKDPAGAIDQNSIKMRVNGQEVTGTATKAGDNLTFEHKPTADFSTDQEVKVDVDLMNGGRAQSISWTFATEIDLAKPGTMFIETEDFDYDGGQYITNVPIGVPAGPYAGGAYQDLGDGLNNEPGNKSFDVDYHEVATNSDQAIYRPNTGVEAGKSGDTAGIGFSRGSFDVEVNHVVGWNGVGDWFNYTREFPTPDKNYKVFIRASSGGQPIHLQLDEVTEGRGTKNQTLQKLGEVEPGRATAGWDGPGTYEIFPLINDDGSRAIVTLGGLTTLRLTTVSGENDQDVIIFQETTDTPPVGGGSVTFTGIRVTGGNVVIEFTGSGALQSADSPLGPWTDVAGATSPYTVTASGGAKYFRGKP